MLADKAENERQLNEIKLKRGWVATNFAFLEGVIARIICVNYFGKDNEEFVEDVLEDEYFNFGLLVKIFEKVVKKKNIEFPVGKLRRLQALRNIIIHSQIVAVGDMIQGSNKIVALGNPEFKNGGKKLIIKEVFSEYDKLEEEIRKEFEKIPGGRFEKIDFL